MRSVRMSRNSFSPIEADKHSLGISAAIRYLSSMLRKSPLGAIEPTHCLLFTLGWLMFSGSLLFGQPRSNQAPVLPRAFTVDVWTSDDGLPQNSIQAIGQTPDGYLWLGTQGGLIRFDGRTFVTYHQANTPELQQDWINALTITRDGTIWIGAYDHGLMSYNGQVFTHQLDTVDLGRVGVVALTEDSSGRIWAGTRTAGIVVFDKERVNRIRTRDGLPSDDIRTLFTDRTGTVWVGTARGIAMQTGSQWRVFTRRDGLPDDIVESIGQDASGALMIGTRSGLAVLKNGSIRTVQQLDPRQRILSLQSAQSGTAWVGTYAGGLYAWNGSVLEAISLIKGDKPSVSSLYQDPEGSLWIGTNGFGLFRLRQSRAVGLTAPTRLSSGSIWSLCEDVDGAIWVGTDGSGVDRLTRESRTTFTTREGLPHNTVYAIIADREGSVWMATEKELARYHAGRIESIRPGGPHILEGAQSLFVDRSGAVWVGVIGTVIGRYSRGEWSYLTAADGLPRNFGTCLWQDSDGTMWIGSDGSGIAAYVNGKTVLHTNEHGLSNESINCFYQDSTGRMWAGTYGGGLNRFADGRWTSVTTANGLAEDIIFSIERDEYGMVWLSGNLGLYRVSESELIACASGRITRVHGMLIDNLDGMPSRECCGGIQPASLRTRSGSLWYPTVRGVAVVNPSTIRTNLVAPPVDIQQVRAERSPVRQQPVMELGPGVRDLEFTYAGLSFIAPEHLRFRYRLDGYDNDWIDAGSRREAFYTGLFPGTYVFRVQAANRDGVWNEKGATVSITLKPMWYQSWWFFILSGAILLLSGYGIYRYRVRQLLEHEEELQRRVDEALVNIKVLGGLIPICANCKKIRDDKGYWNNLERYIHEHSEAKFSHSLCPECMEKLYGSFLKKDPMGNADTKKKL
ncbi:MAG: hypothetical protein MUF82_00175 [Bacteroidetes bacterium]|nr:hypothetical protein [Bacteroidota bacterium]